jgi:PAS domain S-box-containing protein
MMSGLPPKAPDLRETLGNLKPSTHVGHVYDTREELLRVAVPAIRIGLERGEHCVYVSGEAATKALVDALRAERVGVDDDLQTGALTLDDGSRTRARDPDDILRTCEERALQAKKSGSPGLRVVIDMSALLGDDPSTDTVVKLEHALTRLTERHQILVICQYDRRLSGPELCIPALRSHPRVMSGALACDNHYYIPETPIRSGLVANEILDRLLTDLRARQGAEDDLRRTERLFALFMDHLPGYAWMKRVDGGYEYINSKMLAIPGYRSEWRGKTDDDLWPSHMAGIYRGSDRQVAETGQALQAVEQYFLEDQQRFVLVSKFPVINDTGAVVMVAGTAVDITDRIRAEQALRESDERFRELAASIDDVFWMTDRDCSRVLYVSPAYERIWGRTCESLYASPKSWMDLVHEEDRERVIGLLARRVDEHTQDYVYRIVRSDASTRWIHERWFPIRDQQGEIVRFAGIASDISLRKQAEHDLEDAHARLQGVSRRVIEAQEGEKRRLARELHDHIGQALTAIKLNLQSLKAPESSSSPALEDSIAIVDQLLQQARQLSLDLRPPLLDDLGLVPALRWHLDEQAQRAGLRAEFSADSSGNDLSADVAIACFRVAQEAITNVVRHAKASQVELGLRWRGDYVHLMVCDDGIGFDVARPQQEAGRGRALGLVGMRERTALLGGRLSIKSQPGSGTDVHAVFPTRGAGRR